MGRRNSKLTISFDLDGTLTTSTFVDSVWLEGLPRLLAQKQGISFDSARQMCVEAYAQVGDDSILWYRLSHWLGHFGLDGVEPESFIAGFGDRLELFDDVLPVLESLKSQGHDLLLFSNAARPFLNVEVAKGNLEPYFPVMISVSDDWDTVKSDPGSFQRLKDMAGPDLVHVGDHRKFDYETPRSVGITSYHICRNGCPPSQDSLTSLHQLTALVGL
jgi:5'-nucleotidase